MADNLSLRVRPQNQPRAKSNPRHGSLEREPGRFDDLQEIIRLLPQLPARHHAHQRQHHLLRRRGAAKVCGEQSAVPGQHSLHTEGPQRYLQVLVHREDRAGDRQDQGELAQVATILDSASVRIENVQSRGHE